MAALVSGARSGADSRLIASVALFVIADTLFHRAMTINVTIFTALAFGLFWYALPLGRRAANARAALAHA